jgi:hypothetical protein
MAILIRFVKAQLCFMMEFSVGMNKLAQGKSFTNKGCPRFDY